MKKCVILFVLFVLTVFLLSGLVWADVDGSYRVSELISDVQVWTKGDRDLDDSTWLEVVNLGLDNMSTKADCAVETTTIDLVSGTSEYALPAHFQKLWAVKNITSQFVYDKINVGDQLKSTTGFEVEREKVYAYKKSLGFSEAPLAADSVLVYYFHKPTAVTDTGDVLDILPVYTYALKIACRLEIWDRIERNDKAIQDRVLLINEINNAKVYLASQPPDIIVGKRLIPRDAE